MSNSIDERDNPPFDAPRVRRVILTETLPQRSFLPRHRRDQIDRRDRGKREALFHALAREHAVMRGEEAEQQRIRCHRSHLAVAGRAPHEEVAEGTDGERGGEQRTAEPDEETVEFGHWVIWLSGYWIDEMTR